MTPTPSELRELVAHGVIESDSGWFVEGYTTTGLSIIRDGLRSGIYPIICEGPQAALIVAAVNALPALLDERDAAAARESALMARVAVLEEALAPFVDLKAQNGAWGVISKKLDGMSPLTVTVTKAQMLAARATIDGGKA